ncbi:hypothetical protein [Rhodopirellula bahusiensis]|uniref:Uncharacterized protein n=1 Tax=Rhodopirellula bahusiensis TaxID=2014065 RepID=A0A2G1W0U0_9BACT|nr:hypothetical protein CEE69_24770 [Rhodopirellula bahusiensis]
MANHPPFSVFDVAFRDRLLRCQSRWHVRGFTGKRWFARLIAWISSEDPAELAAAARGVKVVLIAQSIA